MYPFYWQEIILYFIPVILLVLISKYGRKYLTEGKNIKLAIIDVMHPVIWVCFHFLSLAIFYFSLVPVLLLILSVYCIFSILYSYRKKEEINWYALFRRVSSVIFIISFISYYILVIVRIIQAIIN